MDRHRSSVQDQTGLFVKRKRGKKCKICLGFCFPCCLLTGLACIGLGVALYVEFPDLITSQIDKKVTIQEGHATYEQLQNPTIPIYKDFYFFDLTNYKEFAESKGKVKPILKEKGPYSYREYRTKEFQSSGDPDEISYIQKKIFIFDDAASGPNLTENDIICTINIPLVAAINEAKDSLEMRGLLRGVIEISRAKLYTCQKASALAWNYTDALVKLLHTSGKYPSKYVNLQVNNSADDRLGSTIHTGVGDVTKIGQFVKWNGLTKLKTWNNFGGDKTGANDINGTEGFFFKPNLQAGESLSAFVDDIKRSFDIMYKEQVKPLGVTGFRYALDNKTFVSAFKEPSNARWGSWCPDGMIYLGPTQIKEIPVYGSKPHFLDGDPLLLESVEGLSPPDRDKHETIIDVEPTTGANLNFNRRLQINVQVNRTEKLPFYKVPMSETSEIVGYNNSGVLYYPVLYVDEHATMDAAFKQYLESKGLKEVHIFNIMVPVVFGVLLFLGVVFLLISLFTCACFVKRSRRRNDDGTRTPLLDKIS